MYLMIREGTVARDLRNLIPVVNQYNSRRCLFVTDDKHLDDLVLEGSIDHNVRQAIAEGISPITAIQMATINAAECFGLEDKGAIAAGYRADFSLVDDLETVRISHVYKDGIAVVQDGKLIADCTNSHKNCLKQSVHFDEILESNLNISLSSKKANIIEIIPNSLITHHIVEEVNICDQGFFQPSTTADQLKLAVIERHHRTKQIGLGIVKGLGLKEGAIAATIAHDSHNLIIAGTNDRDMVLAANSIKKMQGGLIVIKDGQILAALDLPIAGLISDRPYREVYACLNTLHIALEKLGAYNHFNPFLTLSFLALPVIPELKLTDKGLFKVSKFEHIEISSV
jgi:adenine deaminase